MTFETRGDGTPVETKLRAPGPLEEWVDRKDLVGYLAGLAAPFVLVKAPVGFGKTILVAQWRWSAAERRPFAWVSLDPDDDDPARLWLHVVTALQRACPGFPGDSIARALRVQGRDIAGIVPHMVVNALAGLEEPAVLVLDDYGAIKDRCCLDQLGFLLLHLPAPMRLVVITRSEPPLPVTRLHTVGELCEIGMQQLRFSSAEVATLVRKVAAVELGEAELRKLTELTEGWPAAVYLAALSLRGDPVREGLSDRFFGTNRDVASLLTSEVIGGQPSHIRTFLRRTAILPRFSAPLCDAVIGSDDAAEIMSILQRENLFVLPLDDRRLWFRYHHLFAKTLHSELLSTEPGLIPVLHRRASEWHRVHGSVDEAVDHALAARDTVGTLRLVERHWFGHLAAGKVATVQAWLRTLGDHRIARDPVAAHCAMWAAASARDMESLRKWLPVVEASEYEGRLPDGMRSLKSSAALLRGLFGSESIWAMLRSAATAIDLEEDPASVWYGVARTVFGVALYYSGDFTAAAEALEAVLHDSTLIAGQRMLISAFLSLATVENGGLAQAERLAHESYEIATHPDSPFRHLPSGGYARAAAGALCVAQGELAQARAEFEEALHLLRGRYPVSQWSVVDVDLRLASALLDLGNREEAAALVDEVGQVLASFPEGAGFHETRLRRLQRRLAGRPYPESPLPDDPLTAREQAVLRLLTGNLSRHEIAQQIGVSVNTVKAHTRAIYRKLGASTRDDAIARGRQAGLI